MHRTAWVSSKKQTHEKDFLNDFRTVLRKRFIQWNIDNGRAKGDLCRTQTTPEKVPEKLI